MKREDFEALIGQLEFYSARRPGLYLMRVGLLAALGYAYLFGLLALVLVVTTLLVWMVISIPNAATLKLAVVGGLAALGLGWSLLRSLWVKLTPPKGLELKPETAPELFSMIRGLCKELDAPPFHRVLLTGDLNASVVQVPRLGVFGWQQNYLMLGLPLMDGLSAVQFRSVLAHECAHLSRNHSRFAAWIYRVRRTWTEVCQRMVRQGGAGWGLVSSFVKWYGPYFDAYSFVLARSNEYEADRCAAKIAGVNAAAEALMKIQVQGALLSTNFWPSIYQQASTIPAPPGNAFVDLANTLRAGPSDADHRKWLAQAFQVPTNTADTHPCLKDRLRSIGFLPQSDNPAVPEEVPLDDAPSAAVQLLGGKVDSLRAEIEQRWRCSIEKNWKERFDQAQGLDKKLKDVEAKLASEPRKVERLWERATLIANLQGEEKAEPFLIEVLEAKPEHPAANFMLGRIRLARADDAGIENIERAMAADPDAVQPGCNLLYGYYQRTGRHDKTKALVERFDKQGGLLDLARAERARATAKDPYIPHELNPEQIKTIVDQLVVIPEIGSAFLARKYLRHFPEKPLYVLAVKRRVKWYQIESSTAVQVLTKKLINELKFPGPTIVFVAHQNLKSLGKKIRNVPGSNIYSRTDS
jgi:Zn-dependent protease with chaperone function